MEERIIKDINNLLTQLFQKMHEAGYEWDAEKKELKKIPNALEECEIEHIEHGKYYYCIKDYYTGGYKKASKGEVVQALRGMDIMGLGVKANEYFIPVKCIVDVRHDWSEEDERILNRIQLILEFYDRNYAFSGGSVNGVIPTAMPKSEIPKYVDWLKSLKPQPKYKWTDEDEKNLKDLLAYGETKLGLRRWIAGLPEKLGSRSEYHWKPSEEQLEALWNAIPHIPNSEKDIDVITELSTLYECLENL